VDEKRQTRRYHGGIIVEFSRKPICFGATAFL
jgi:hypothetical protein